LCQCRPSGVKLRRTSGRRDERGERLDVNLRDAA
jgi:hypothetical protein